MCDQARYLSSLLPIIYITRPERGAPGRLATITYLPGQAGGFLQGTTPTSRSLWKLKRPVSSGALFKPIKHIAILSHRIKGA